MSGYKYRATDTVEPAKTIANAAQVKQVLDKQKSLIEELKQDNHDKETALVSEQRAHNKTKRQLDTAQSEKEAVTLAHKGMRNELSETKKELAAERDELKKLQKVNEKLRGEAVAHENRIIDLEKVLQETHNTPAPQPVEEAVVVEGIVQTLSVHGKPVTITNGSLKLPAGTLFQVNMRAA